jgi:serine/threonine protein phosphatase PrpC
VKAVLLAGREHAEVGAVGEQALARVAVALSRGGAEKRYDYTDPNEDVALAAEGSRGVLVAVADGHWGHRAAEVALVHLRDAHLEAWLDGAERSPESWYQELLHALVSVNDAILAAHTAHENPRTTLALALARPAEGLLIAASVGDSHLFVAGEQQVVEPLSRQRQSKFLGHEPRKPSQLARDVRIEVQPLGDARALLAVTDGLSERGIGVEDPSEAVKMAVASADATAASARGSVAARALVDAALAAHRKNDAGDNIAAAVAWLAR